MLANNNISLVQLKTSGGWKSDSAVQGYIEESEPGKLEIASRVGLFRNTTAENSNLAKEESQQSDSNVHISIDMSSSSNCSLKFVVPAQFLGKRYRLLVRISRKC